MLFDVSHALMGQVTEQDLLSQLQDLCHYMPKSVEELSLVLLQVTKTEKVGKYQELFSRQVLKE